MTTKDTIKETILDLLEQHTADDITVKMVCIESGLSKQTLYNHYYNWMDALSDAFRAEFYGSVGSSDTYIDWVEGFRRVLVFLQKRKKAFIHVYNSSRRDELMEMIESNGRQLVGRGIRECSEDIGIPVSDKDYEFMLSFYMYVFMGIVRKYFDGRMTESPEYIASRCDAMMRYHIRNSLANLEKLELGEF